MTIEQLDDVAGSFVGWQCRLRQHVVRRGDGRPSPGMFAAVTLPDGQEPGSFITVLNKLDPEAASAQFQHIVKKTHDPRERYEAAVKMLQTVYYQYPREFSDELTALFGAKSALATTLAAAGRGHLVFGQATQRYRFDCAIALVPVGDPVYEATYWHNAMFNPQLMGPATVLRMTPDWSSAVTETT